MFFFLKKENWEHICSTIELIIWGSYNVLREDKRIVPDQIEHFLPLGLEWWTTCQHVEEQDAKSPPRKPLISILYERKKYKKLQQNTPIGSV